MSARRRASLLAVTTVVVVALLVWSARGLGVRSAGFAFLTLWLTMCWITVLDLVVPLRLPPGWFELHPVERQGRIYRRVGVTVAKRLLRRGPMTLFNPSLKLPAAPDRAALDALDRAMRKAETSHVLLFAIGLGVMGHALVRGWWDAAGWTVLFNVVINGYPVMLQRYNRGRLSRLRSPEA